MKTITTSELVKEITATGQTLSALKARSIAEKDEDGFHARIEVMPGLVVVWVANKNYQGGRRNGYGAGLYAVAAASKAMSNTWLLEAAE